MPFVPLCGYFSYSACYNPLHPCEPPFSTLLQHARDFEEYVQKTSRRPSLQLRYKNQLTNLQSPELAPYWLSALIESADDAIISKTLDGIITSWNAGAERIFGYTADEVIGKPVTILIPEGISTKNRQSWHDSAPVNASSTTKLSACEKTDKLIDISLTVSPIIGPNGKIIGASKIARDITEQRQARRALDEASERLKLALDCRTSWRLVMGCRD